MRLHTFCLGLLVALASSLSAQCRNLGSPGGSGCGLSTPFGIPTLACVGSPQIGNQSFAMNANLPCVASSPVLLLGGCLSAPLVIRGPFGVGGFCGPSEAVCAVFVDLSMAVVLPGLPRQGGATFPLPIPGDASLTGARLCAQAANLCTIPGGACLGASHGVSLTLF